MYSITDTILKAFQRLNLTTANTLNKELIKLEVKARLTDEEVKEFNYLAKKHSDGLYYTKEDLKKNIIEISLSKRGFDLIYQYDRFNTELKIYEIIVGEFLRVNKTRKKANPDQLPLFNLVTEIESHLNPKMIAERAIENALFELQQEGLITIKEGIVKLTPVAFAQMYPEAK